MPQNPPLPEGFALVPAAPQQTQAPAMPEGFSVVEPEQEAPSDPFAERVAHFSTPLQREAATRALTAREAGDEVAEREATIELSGLLSGGDTGEGGERMGSRGETAVRSFGSALFGIGDPIAAAAGAIRDRLDPNTENTSFRENLIFQRARRQGMQRENPVSATTGFVGGLASGGLGASALKAAPGVIGQGARALTLTRSGAPVANVARLAGQGAISGGITAGAESGGDLEAAGEGALLGGAAGPVGAGVVKGLGAAGTAIGRRALSSRAAISTLARRLDITPDELDLRIENFRMVNGRTPSLAEIIGERAGREIADPISVSRGATETMQQFAERSAPQRAEELGGAIRRGRVQGSQARVNQRRGASFDDFMSREGQTQVPLSTDEIRFLMDPDIQAALPRAAKSPLRAALTGVDMNDPDALISMSLRDVDNIRQALAQAGRGGGAAARFRGDADAVRAIAQQEVPAFGDALEEFARRSRTGEGVAMGRQALRRAPGETQEFVDEAARMTPEGRAGLRVGARTALTEQAAEGPVGAARTARALAEDSGLERRLQTAVGPEETARLRQAGEINLEAQRGVSAATPRIDSLAQGDSAAVQDLVAAAVLTTGRASGAFQANVGIRLARFLGGEGGRADALARALTDPAQTQRAVDQLRQLGMRTEQITEIIQSAARASGVAAGQQVEQ